MPPPYKLNPLYTPDFMASLQRGYMETHEPLWSIAARHGIGEPTLENIVRREGWPKRRERARKLIPAQHLLEEAEAMLAAQTPTSHPPPPADAGAPGTLSPPAERGKVSAVERIERLVLGEVEIEEARREKLTGLSRPTAEAARTARTLAILTQTLHALQRLRFGEHTPRGEAPDEKADHDDELPRDIDEFRRDLARRIDAFVASRTDGGAAAGDPAALVDAP